MSDTTQPTARTLGVHHVGLTVTDLDVTRRFFADVLGFRTVAERPSYPAVFVTDGTVLLTLWRAQDPEAAVPFDRKRGIGLHHLALRVADGTTLDALHRDIAGRSECSVEFAPELLGAGPARHMMCSLPCGIRLELIAPEG